MKNENWCTVPPIPPLPSQDIPDAIGALAQLLQRELISSGVSAAPKTPRTAGEFTHWYLEVVQLLEAQVAGGAGVQPMTRPEVELLCRCALSGRDLRHAIALCQKYCAALYPRAGSLYTVESDGAVYVQLDSLRTTVSSASSLCDITGLFAFCQLFQWLVGVDLQLQQVRIGPISREDMLPFLKLFGAPVLAGGLQYALVFPVAVLDLPVIRNASEFSSFFEVYPCSVFRRTVNDLTEQVALVLSASALRGSGLPRQEDVAYSLGLPLTSFRRRLALSGKSFQQLREDCLRERAETLLTRREYSIAEVASQLGYSDAAAFRRAFRRWHGCSPSERRHRQPNA